MPVVIMSYGIGLNICAITVGIKEYKSTIKNKKKHEEIVSLAKLKNIEVLIFKALIDSNISHYECFNK